MSEFYNNGNNFKEKSFEKKRRNPDSLSRMPQRPKRPAAPKLNPTGKSPIPKGTLLIGDSMIRLINPDEFEKELFLFSYPGIMANDLDDLLSSEYLPPPSRVGTVILHVGANNASTDRENQTIQTASKNVCNCIDTLAEFYPGAKLWYSAILPRLDKDHDRAKEINQAVHKYCKTFEPLILQFVDFSIDFYQNAKRNGALDDVKKELYRYSEGHTDDTVHLGVEGNKVLKELFENLMAHNDRERAGEKVDNELLIDQEEFDEWRVGQRGEMGEIKRFRITNWGPAQERKNSKRASPKKENKWTPKQKAKSRSKKSFKGSSSGYNAGYGYNNGSGGYNTGGAYNTGKSTGPTDDPFDTQSSEEEMDYFALGGEAVEFSDEEENALIGDPMFDDNDPFDDQSSDENEKSRPSSVEVSSTEFIVTDSLTESSISSSGRTSSTMPSRSSLSNNPYKPVLRNGGSLMPSRKRK